MFCGKSISRYTDKIKVKHEINENFFYDLIYFIGIRIVEHWLEKSIFRKIIIVQESRYFKLKLIQKMLLSDRFEENKRKIVS